MNYAAIWHRPSSEYAFALDDTHYVFRLRAVSYTHLTLPTN